MRPIDFFDRGAMSFPDEDCLVEGNLRSNYRQVQRNSHLIANGLRALGLGHQTKIGLYSPNAARAMECMLGILRSGGVYVPVNARNALDENCYILDNTDVEILLFHSSFQPQIDQIRERCPKIRACVQIDGPGVPGQPACEQWLAAPFVPTPEAAIDRDAPAAIPSSGGTTGKPKGVVHSQLTWEMSVANILTSMPITGRPVHLMVAPMTHAAGGLAFPLFAAGATQVVMASFDAGEVLAAIEQHRVTHLFLPPTAVYSLLAHPEVRNHDYRSLQYFIYAAAPMSVEKVKEAIEVFGPCMTQTYGQAEAGPLIGTFFSPEAHMQALRENPARLASCGRPTLFTAIDIVDDDGNVLPPGEAGEIAIGGNFLMSGYYRNPEATAEVLRNGRVHTGDIGRMDADGFVYIVDRKREMIITGGFNVFPSEIEQVVFMHPAVQDCAVVGVPDEKWGEAVKAVVQLRPGRTATETEIIALCRAKLSGVQTPKSVDFWPDLPRSPVGKVLRRDVRARFWEGRTRVLV